MDDKIQDILLNASYFQNADEIEDIKGLIDRLLDISLEPGININYLREQLYLIKFDIE